MPEAKLTSSLELFLFRSRTTLWECDEEIKHNLGVNNASKLCSYSAREWISVSAVGIFLGSPTDIQRIGPISEIDIFWTSTGPTCVMWAYFLQDLGSRVKDTSPVIVYSLLEISEQFWSKHNGNMRICCVIDYSSTWLLKYFFQSNRGQMNAEKNKCFFLIFRANIFLSVNLIQVRLSINSCNMNLSLSPYSVSWCINIPTWSQTTRRSLATNRTCTFLTGES